MMSDLGHLPVILFFAFGRLFRLLSHLAIIIFTVHASRVRDRRNKQRKGNKE